MSFNLKFDDIISSLLIPTQLYFRIRKQIIMPKREWFPYFQTSSIVQKIVIFFFLRFLILNIKLRFTLSPLLILLIYGELCIHPNKTNNKFLRSSSKI